MKARLGTGAALGVALATASVTGGAAQAAEPVIETSLRAGVVATAFDGDGSEAVTARASGFVQAGALFENQIEAGVGLGVAAERDNPTRDPRGGSAGSCSPAIAGCPQIGGAPLRGFVSGAHGGPEADEGPRLSLESAYLYVRGGWGEVSLGRDEGAAGRFSLSPPSILTVGGAIDPSLDGTGLGGVFVRNDLSGQSAKVFVASERIVGVRLAASYTPEAEHRGLDQGYGPFPPAFEPAEIAEAGASFAHTFAGGLEVAAALTWATAEDDRGRAAFDRMETQSAGVTLGRGPWRVGVAGLRNDNGWRAGDADYTGAAASFVWEANDWSFMLEGGRTADDLVGLRTSAVTAAARKALSDKVGIAFGANWRERDSLVDNGVAAIRRRDSGAGAFLEFSWEL